MSKGLYITFFRNDTSLFMKLKKSWKSISYHVTLGVGKE